MLKHIGMRLARPCSRIIADAAAATFMMTPKSNSSFESYTCTSSYFLSISHAAHGRDFSAASSTSTPSASGPASAIAMQQSGMLLPEQCCGCGIRLQQSSPDSPGYFIVPSKVVEAAMERQERQAAAGSATSSASSSGMSEEDEYERSRLEVDNELEAHAARRHSVSTSSNELDGDDGLPGVICQRCFSLRHQGRVKVESAEGLLPAFDLGRKVGRKIFLQKDRRAVVLCVVDVWDFDGSLPRQALQSLYPPGIGKEAPENVKFKLMVAVNKCDLLPPEATEARVNQWVRQRMIQAGLPRPDKVFLVSAVTRSGVREIVQDVKSALGFRGDLWVVGAQNVGKSSLISAMKRLGGTAGKREPTIAPYPGTTLGLLNVPGLPLGPKHRVFDTPGVLHHHQITSRLTLEDVKAVLPIKQLKPRTFRVGAGNTLLLGGLARLDIIAAPSSTIYLTVYVSHFVDMHMGKTEGTEERLARHVGTMLTPPYSPTRAAECESWTPRDLSVDGKGWDQSSKDIAIAGLGWIAVGCKGPADFRLWTLPGISVTTHDALVLEYAKDLERPGFSSILPKTGENLRAGPKQEAPLSP